MEDFPVHTISSFKELLNEILWSWEFPNYDLHKDEKGNFYLNKLYITPTHATYKLEHWKLTPIVFEDVQRFYEFLQTTHE